MTVHLKTNSRIAVALRLAAVTVGRSNTALGEFYRQSRRGNCFDNAPMESFWGTLKNELVHYRRYATRHEAKA